MTIRVGRLYLSHATLCRDDFSELVSPLPGPAVDGSEHPAVVRRIRRCLDDLHALLPGVSPGGVSLRAPFGALLDSEAAGDRPYPASGGSVVLPSDRPGAVIETYRRRAPDPGDPGCPDSHGRFSILSSVRNIAAPAGLVL